MGGGGGGGGRVGTVQHAWSKFRKCAGPCLTPERSWDTDDGCFRIFLSPTDLEEDGEAFTISEHERLGEFKRCA